jgi:hypothetical protein
MIADMSNVSFWKPPTKILKIFNFLQNKYLCRLSSLHIYGMNYVLTMCWKIVKKLIDERTAQKFNFISGEDDVKNLVLNNIHPTQLEQRFGGEAEDVGEDLDFPFLLPSNEYQVDDRNDDQIVSEEEYIRLANEDKLVTISPYLIEEGKINNIDNINNNKEDIKIVFNEKGNPVYNNVEFFECLSRDYENSNMSFEENSENNQSSNENDKLYSKRKNNLVNNLKSTSESGTNELNTVFELNENRANCCNCKSCVIF